MPLYEYKCEQCGDKITMLRNLTDKDKDIHCPKCKTKTLKRVISSFSSSSSDNFGHTHDGC